MRHRLHVALVLVSWLTGVLGQAIPQFRSTVTGIGLPVSVSSNGTPVLDLTASDFELIDAGTRQEILAVDRVGVPLDVTVVVQDAILTGGFGLATFEAEVRAVATSLAPVDRMGVRLASPDQRRQSLPLTEDLRARAAREFQCAPVYDALARGLMQPTAPDRQSIVVLISVGEGRGGFMSTSGVTEIAKRSHVRLYVVTIEPIITTTHRSYVATSVCPEAETDWSQDRQRRLRQIAELPSEAGWRQLWVDGKNRLVAIAELTGGREIRPTVLTQNTTGPIREVLDEARASYILRYTPKGVPDTGWHPITVKVTRPGNYDIRVRPGYER